MSQRAAARTGARAGLNALVGLSFGDRDVEAVAGLPGCGGTGQGLQVGDGDFDETTERFFRSL